MTSQGIGKRLEVQYIARAILGRSRSRSPAFMAILSAYLDASGSAREPSCCILAVAGYVATDEVWKSVETQWQAVISDAGITHFHAKNFVHSRGEFASWKGDKQRRDNFIEQLASIIRSHNLEGFSMAMNMEHYRTVDRTFRLHETFSAYTIAAVNLMSKIRKWHEARSSDSLLFILEKGDNEQDSLRKFVQDPQKWGDIREPLFLSKRLLENGSFTYCVPLQVSDYLAYEHAKNLSDFFVKGKRIVRESLYRTRYGAGTMPSDRPMGMILDGRFLMDVCQFFNIRRRV